ncbi:MAG TPA: hypothetical protein VI078_14500 [bacterium]
MNAEGENGPPPLSNADLARVLSPLLLFVLHAVYLAVWSREPFFNKWVDGSFSFFLSLVLCNIVRSRVVAAHAARHAAHDPAHNREDQDREGHGS